MCPDSCLVIIDKGSKVGFHWKAFHLKNNNSFFFDSFGGQPEEFLVQQLPKPITYHNYEIQDIRKKIMWILLFILFLSK